MPASDDIREAALPASSSCPLTSRPEFAVTPAIFQFSVPQLLPARPSWLLWTRTSSQSASFRVSPLSSRANSGGGRLAEMGLHILAKIRWEFALLNLAPDLAAQ
jgi:hypothetical protein